MKKNKKNIIKIIVAIFLILVIACIFLSNYLTEYAIGRSGDGGNRKVKVSKVEKPEDFKENKEKQKVLTDKFIDENKEETVTIEAKDGIKLTGYIFKKEDNQKWAIIIHGYRQTHKKMYDYAQRYFEQGYNVLLPDLRGGGSSEGKYIGMGYLDKDDMTLWVQYIYENEDKPEIVVHGLSMGAATTMMMAPENKNVRVYIEEAGYTNAYDMLASELKLRFKLPSFPVLYLGDIIGQIKAKYSLKLAAPIKALKKTKAPMMFIHGTKDNFVPFKMLDELYNAKLGDNKYKLVVENAGHTESRYVLGEQYWKEVFSFIEKYR